MYARRLEQENPRLTGYLFWRRDRGLPAWTAGDAAAVRRYLGVAGDPGYDAADAVERLFYRATRQDLGSSEARKNPTSAPYLDALRDRPDTAEGRRIRARAEELARR